MQNPFHIDVTPLEAERIRLLGIAKDLDGADPEYHKIMKEVDKLSTLITNERRKPLDPNVVFSTLGSLGAVLTIARFEQLAAFTSKAVGFIRKF